MGQTPCTPVRLVPPSLAIIFQLFLLVVIPQYGWLLTQNHMNHYPKMPTTLSQPPTSLQLLASKNQTLPEMWHPTCWEAAWPQRL